MLPKAMWKQTGLMLRMSDFIPDLSVDFCPFISFEFLLFLFSSLTFILILLNKTI